MSASKVTILVALLALTVSAGASSDEDALRRFFEGKEVVLLMDLPATTKGVNVRPEQAEPVEVQKVSKKLSSAGIGVKRGVRVTVTKVKVKKKHIEFQFGSGGSNPKPTLKTEYVSESKRQRDLRDRLKKATSANERKRYQDEFDRFEALRQLEQRDADRRNRESYERAVSVHTDEAWALMAGSRFNVRYDKRVPAAALTVEGLMQSLEAYVNFSPSSRSETAADPSGAGASSNDALQSADLALRKGLSEQDVEVLFGAPETCREDRLIVNLLELTPYPATDARAGLTVTTCLYTHDEGRLEAKFVEGVLVKYLLSSGGDRP